LFKRFATSNQTPAYPKNKKASQPDVNIKKIPQTTIQKHQKNKNQNQQHKTSPTLRTPKPGTDKTDNIKQSQTRQNYPRHQKQEPIEN
jgi:hypothetical protein